MKQQKGITLIALVITIIVLLILAGVTIAMLTGTDSAPVKANEAKQKQDIGSAKDQVYLYVADYQTDAYDRVYVQGKGAATDTQSKNSTEKAKDIGTLVGGKVAAKANNFNTSVGLATIDTNDTEAYENQVVPNDVTATAYIRIYTTDFETFGYIDGANGSLHWDSTIKTK